jgi:hypothetical protein
MHSAPKHSIINGKVGSSPSQVGNSDCGLSESAKRQILKKQNSKQGE